MVADDIPSFTASVPHKIRHIFDDEVSRFLLLQDSDYVVKKIAPLRTLKPFLVTGFRKRLARKASAKNVVFWDRVEINGPNVTRRTNTKILLIQISKIRIEFGGEHALTAALAERLVESAESCE